MENATKALLIAASILIVIVLIAISIKFLVPGKTSTDQAEALSGQMSESTTNATKTIEDALSGLNKGTDTEKPHISFDHDNTPDDFDFNTGVGGISFPPINPGIGRGKL